MVADIYPVRVYWQGVLADLKAVGISYRQIGRALGVELSSVQVWLRGGEPRHSMGAALLELHTQHCGEASTLKRIADARPIESAARTSGNPGSAPRIATASGRD